MASDGRGNVDNTASKRTAGAAKQARPPHRRASVTAPTLTDSGASAMPKSLPRFSAMLRDDRARTPDISLARSPLVTGGADMSRSVHTSQGLTPHSTNVPAGHERANERPMWRSILNMLITPKANQDARAKSGERRDAEAPLQRRKLSALAMPSARRSGLVLDETSPPLFPDSWHHESGELECSRPSSAQSRTRPAYVAPRHAWSTAQASADAAASTYELDGVKTLPGADWRGILHGPTDSLPMPGGRDCDSPAGSSVSCAPSLAWSLDDGANEVTTTRGVSRWLQRGVRYCLQNIRGGVTSGSAEMPDFQDASVESRFAVWLPHAQKLGILALIFLAATSVLGYLLSTLPLRLPAHLADLTLTEIRDICAELRQYSRSNQRAMWHVFFVLSTLFTWKQAFCVPGSLIMNIVFGAMYGAYAGAFYASMLTALGGVFCYFLAAPFAEIVQQIPGIAKPLNSMRVALAQTASQKSKSMQHATASVGKNLWSYLMVLRLLPIVPYGMMNIACGVLRVPLLPYAATLGAGSIPWNFCTTQIGELLQDVVTALQTGLESKNAAASASPDAAIAMSAAQESSLLSSGAFTVLLDRIWTFDMMVKLLLLSCASMLPLVLNRWLGSYRDGSQVEPSPDVSSDEEQDDVSQPRRFFAPFGANDSHPAHGLLSHQPPRVKRMSSVALNLS